MTVFWTSGQVTLHHGDVLACLRELPDESVHCVVTSSPYWGLRDYGTDGQIGLEASPDAYVQRMVEVFRDVRRVLRADGTLWLNLGDSYASSGVSGRGALNKLGERMGTGGGHKHSSVDLGRAPTPEGLKPKDLIGIPWRVALALQADGWWLRSEITWCKRAPMPESVTDRPTSATEKVFLLAKAERYFYDADAVREPNAVGPAIDRAPIRTEPHPDNPYRRGHVAAANGSNLRPNPAGRNMRNYWLLGPSPYPDAHFATFVPEIPRRAILAGTSERGCCAECGAPWARVVERTRPDSYEGQGMRHGNDGNGMRMPDKWTTETQTTGWQSTCAHEAPVAPATVLDPFIGSGTTCMVATSLGRRSIGIDLNAEYLKLAVKRNQQMSLEAAI